MARTRQRPEETRVEAKRPEVVEKRVPLGAGKNVLTAPQREGFRRRFLNDEGDRIALAKRAGYQVVEDLGVEVGDEDVTNRNVSLGTGAEVTVNRDGMKAILMELPEEYGKEDDERKAKDIDERERSITDKGKQQGYYGDVTQKSS